MKLLYCNNRPPYGPYAANKGPPLNTLREYSRRSSCRGFVSVLFCLSLIALLGLVALVVDIGAYSLARQRTLLAIDTATLAASDLLNREADEAPVRDYVRQVVASTLAARQGYSQAKWNELHSQVEVDIDAGSDTARVSASMPVALRRYFGRIFRSQDLTTLVQSAAAFDNAEYIGENSLHLVLLAESSLLMLWEDNYGACTSGGVGISCLRPGARESFCEPGCSGRVTVLREQMKIFAELMGPRDRLTVIAYGQHGTHFANTNVLLEEVALDDAGTRTAFETIYKSDWTYPGRWFSLGGFPSRSNIPSGSPAAAIDRARSLLQASSADTDRSAVVLLSGGDVPWSGPNSYYFPEEWLEYLAHEYSEELSRLEEGDCSYHDWYCDDLFHSDLARWQNECGNLVKFLEQVAGIAAARLQAEHSVPIYTVGIGEGLENKYNSPDMYESRLYDLYGGVVTWVDNPSRDTTFLQALANDHSSLPVGPPLRLDCGMPRSPKLQGRHFSPQPSGYELLKTARELLRLARRDEESAFDEQGFSPRWINPT